MEKWVEENMWESEIMMLFQPGTRCDLIDLQNTRIRVTMICIGIIWDKVLYFKGIFNIMTLINHFVWSGKLCKPLSLRERTLPSRSRGVLQHFRQNSRIRYMSQTENRVKQGCFYLGLNFWMQNKFILALIAWDVLCLAQWLKPSAHLYAFYTNLIFEKW